MSNLKIVIESRAHLPAISLEDGIDLTIPVRESGVQAFHIGQAKVEPFRAGNFIGDVRQNGSCNCDTLIITPHGNGTHTECIGHITKERISVSECLRDSIVLAKLIDITPVVQGSNRVITKELLSPFLKQVNDETALIIRTLPNGPDKLAFNYSGTNPPYLAPEATALIAQHGIEHLIVDLPSVDREDDGGKLLAHRNFWYINGVPRRSCTITELAYIPPEVPAGLFLLSIQIPALPSDAAPSRLLAYPIT